MSYDVMSLEALFPNDDQKKEKENKVTEKDYNTISLEELYKEENNDTITVDQLVSDTKTETVTEKKDVQDVILPTPKPTDKQKQLIEKYSKEYPNFFDNGELVDQKGAEEAGILEVIDYKVDENTQINMPLPSELHTIRYRDDNELKEYKEVKARLNTPLRSKYYVPVEEQTENMLKQDLKNRPFMKKYIDVFGNAGLNAIGHFNNAFKYIRGATADVYQSVHEAVDEVTDGGASKLLKMDARTAAKRFTGDLGQILEVTEAAPFVRLTGSVKSAQTLADDLIKQELKEKKKLIKSAVKAKIIYDRKFNTSALKGATSEASKKAQKRAKDKAKKSLEIKEQLIKEYEQKIDARSKANINEIIDESKLVSKISAGRLILDPEKARKVGKKQAKETYDSQMVGSVADDMDMLGLADNPIANPILDPDTLDPLVAVVSELKSKNPRAFGKGKALIDDLYRLTITKELEASPELLDMLAKYNLNYEKYMLAVVGSGSEAGRVLQKFAMLKKAQRGAQSLENSKLNKQMNDKSLGWKNFIRFINIGRGAMVSQLATTVRNVRSALYRAPMEGLGNVMDNILYQLGEGNFLNAAKGISPIGLKIPQFTGKLDDLNPFKFTVNWKNSFRHMRYMYDDRGDIKEFTNWILDRPQFADEFNRMFNNISEIQRISGRGEATSPLGKGLDFILSEGEDLVDFLNVPNRWQEHIIRRSYFVSTLENLVKREYKVDLLSELKKGRLNDFIGNTSKVKPKGARNFEELLTDSVENALRNTYAARPETATFKAINDFITRSGVGLLLIPFPRFMLSSIELMGKYAGGALIAPLRAIVKPGKFGSNIMDKTSRDLITKNLVGLGAFYGMMEYEKSDQAHPDYKMIKTGDGRVVDTTPDFPLRQFKHLSRIANTFLEGFQEDRTASYEKRLQNGLDLLNTTDFYSDKEIAETFLGQNLRVSREYTIIEDFTNIWSNSDLTGGEQVGKSVGTALGNFFSRYVVPYGMVIDAERALGLRTSDVKEATEETDLTLSGAFEKGFTRPFRRRGIMSPKAEAELPNKVYAFDPDGKRRIAPSSKLFFGLSFYEDDPSPAELFKEYGYSSYILSSKSGSIYVRNRENKLLQNLIPSVAVVAKSLIDQNEQLDSDDPQKLTKTELRKEIRSFIKDNMNSAKTYFEDTKYYYQDSELTPEVAQADIDMGLFEKNLTRFRRKSPEYRVDAISKFRKTFKRDMEVSPVYTKDIIFNGEVIHPKGSLNTDFEVAMQLKDGKDINLFD